MWGEGVCEMQSGGGAEVVWGSREAETGLQPRVFLHQPEQVAAVGVQLEGHLALVVREVAGAHLRAGRAHGCGGAGEVSLGASRLGARGGRRSLSAQHRSFSSVGSALTHGPVRAHFGGGVCVVVGGWWWWWW